MEGHPSSSVRKTTLAQRKGRMTAQRKGRATSHRVTAQRATGLSAVGSEVPVFRFHDNHGSNVELSDDHLTVDKFDEDCYNAVVMSEDPMIPDMLYQVQIDEVLEVSPDIALGVMTHRDDPHHWPDSFNVPFPAVLSVTAIGARVFGHWKNEERPVLKNLPVGSKLGLAVDSDRSLHLYVDGKHQGVVAPDIPTPCYFMFDMYDRCNKVTAVPVTPVP